MFTDAPALAAVMVDLAGVVGSRELRAAAEQVDARAVQAVLLQ